MCIRGGARTSSSNLRLHSSSDGAFRFLATSRVCHFNSRGRGRRQTRHRKERESTYVICASEATMSSLSRALRMSSSRMKPSAVWSKFSNTSASCALQTQAAGDKTKSCALACTTPVVVSHTRTLNGTRKLCCRKKARGQPTKLSGTSPPRTCLEPNK